VRLPGKELVSSCTGRRFRLNGITHIVVKEVVESIATLSLERVKLVFELSETLSYLRVRREIISTPASNLRTKNLDFLFELLNGLSRPFFRSSKLLREETSLVVEDFDSAVEHVGS
jgi:hypothetical protein